MGVVEVGPGAQVGGRGGASRGKLDEVRRIYVASGEHPAAGGLYMFFWSLWYFAKVCGVALILWVAFWLHCGTLGFHFDTPEV